MERIQRENVSYYIEHTWLRASVTVGASNITVTSGGTNQTTSLVNICLEERMTASPWMSTACSSSSSSNAIEKNKEGMFVGWG